MIALLTDIHEFCYLLLWVSGLELPMDFHTPYPIGITTRCTPGRCSSCPVSHTTESIQGSHYNARVTLKEYLRFCRRDLLAKCIFDSLLDCKPRMRSRRANSPVRGQNLPIWLNSKFKFIKFGKRFPYTNLASEMLNSTAKTTIDLRHFASWETQLHR